MGKQKNKWQNREYVLRYFDETESATKKIYRKFVVEGIKEGRRPDLVGGGLIRSQGGWSQVIAMRRHGKKELSDERVLGSGDFVERIIKEADEQFKCQLSEKEKRKKVKQIIGAECRNDKITIKELRSGSRRQPVCRVRCRIAILLFSEYGIPLAEIARNTGVSTSAVSKMVNKSINK